MAVLASSLFGAAALSILLLTPFVFESPPPGLARARTIVLALVVAAGALLLVEWFGVHGGSL